MGTGRRQRGSSWRQGPFSRIIDQNKKAAVLLHTKHNFSEPCLSL